MNNFLSEEDENLELNDPMATPADALHDARTTAEEARNEAVYGEEEPLNDLDNPDVDIFSAVGMEAPATAFAVGGKREIGFGEKLRKGMETETGEKYSTGEAVASRMIPFASKVQKMEANEKTHALEDIYEGTLFSDLDSVSPSAVRKYGWEGSFDIEAIKSRRLNNVSKALGPDGRAFMQTDEFNAMTPDEQLKALRPYAESELRYQTQTRKDAEKTLSETKQGTLSKIGTGAIENFGYTGEFVVGSILGGAIGGFALAGGASAMERASTLGTNDYDFDEYGNLVNKRNAYAEEEAFMRGLAGGMLEAGVETALGGALGLVGKGIAKIPGASRYLVQPAKWAMQKTKGALGKIPGANTLASLGRSYKALSRITGQHEMPMELLEENVQAFVDDVVGLGAKKGEWEGFGREWEDYKRDTLNWNSQRDILLGMVGTMVLQGGFGAAVDKARRAPVEKAVKNAVKFDYTPSEARGRLELLNLKDELNGISNSQAVFLAKFSHLVESLDKNQLQALLSRHDENVRAMGDKIIAQKTFEYDQTLAQNGKDVRFTPDLDADGNINFHPGEYDGEDGNKHEANIILDSTNGVGIRENSDESDDAYTVVDNRGNEIGVKSYESALICANMLAKQNAVKNLENSEKANVISQIVAQNYGAEGAAKFKFVNSANDLIDMLRAEGASEDMIGHALSNVDAGGVRLGDGRVVLMLDNITSPMQAREILQHEVIGHDSLANKLGGKEGVLKFLRSLDSKTMRDYTAMLIEQRKSQIIAALKSRGVEVSPEMENRIEQDAMRFATTDEGVQELFARIVERRRHNPAIWQKLSHFVRERGRARGANTPINDADLEVIISQMEQEARGGGSMEGSIKVSPSLSIGGMTFLRTKDATADVDAETATDGGAEISQADYTAVRSGVSDAMRLRDGASPSDSAVNEFIGQVLGAESWDEASNILAALGEHLTEDVYNLVKRIYDASTNTEGGSDATGHGADEAQPQSEQADGGAPTEGEAPRSGTQKKAGGETRNEIKQKIAGLYESDINRTVYADRISDVVADNWSALDEMEVGDTIKISDGREFKKIAAKGKFDAEWESVGKKKVKYSIKQLALAESAGNIAKMREKEAEAKRQREENRKKRDEALRKARIKRKAVYQRFVDEELINPNSLFSFWLDRGYLFAIPKADSKGNFITDPAAEALNHFFDGMTGAQREIWKNRIFGYDRVSANTSGNDEIVEMIIRHTGNEEFRNNYEAVLEAFVEEYERFQDWKASGAIGRQEREEIERLEAEEAAEREFYLDEIANKELADKEYDNAFAEVERYDKDHPFIEMFSFENLSKLKKGDTIRFDHADVEWIFESFDPKSGVMIVSEPQWAAEERAWADGEENTTPRNVKYRVTKDGISEITEKEEKKDDTEDKRGTSEAGSGDAKSEPGEIGKLKEKLRLRIGGLRNRVNELPDGKIKKALLNQIAKFEDALADEGKINFKRAITALWHIKSKVTDVETGDAKAGYEKILPRAESMIDIFADMGYQIVDNLVGRKHDAGDAVQVIAWEPKPWMKEGEEVYGEVLIPTIRLHTPDGKTVLVQRADVVVYYGKKQDPDTDKKPDTENKSKSGKKSETGAKPEKESAPKSDTKKKTPKKSSLDLGDASSALDDALDGLDDVFGSFSLATFSAPSLTTFSAPNTAGFDPEKFGKQVIAVGKVVNVLASKGFNTFKDLATVIFEKKPELWPNVKPHLRKVWNAIAEENDYEEVSKKEAEAVFSALESGDNTPDTPTEPPTEPPTPPTEPPTDNEPPTPPAPPTPPTEPPAPPSDKPPAPPEPTSGKKRKFTKEEAGKIAFDLGGSEADQKEVADLLGDILFANPEFAVAEVTTQLPTGEKPAAPVAVAPRELTEEERQHNETVILKLIKKLAEMGHKTFDKLVRAIANASYKLYHAVKNTLYTHWQKALDRGVDVDDSISRKQANEVIKEVDDELNDALEVVPPRADGRTQWSLDDQRNAYLALTNRGFAQKNPNALAIANEMLEQGVLVSAIVQDWWKTDDAAYWPVQGLKVEKASDAAALFQMLSNPYVEIFKALYLDKNRRVLEGRVVAIGSRGAVSVSLSSITDKVPKGTVGVILSHNHPTGNVIPSGPVNGQRGDVKTTEEWQVEFRNKGLILLDHIVTDTDKFTSFAAGVSKGQTKLYGNFHFDAQADEHWNPKIVNRGTGLYEYPPIPWELVPREQFGLGFYNGRHSQSIATYFAQQLSTHNQDHSWVVFLNDDQKVTGIIRIPVAEAIKSKEPLSKLVDEIIKYHEEAASVMIYFGRERFKSSEVGLACESNNLNIAAIYSISQGKFIGGRSSTPEDELFLMDGGYQEMLRSGSISEGHIWPDGGKQASRRAPKALPLEVPEKKQYTLKQKGTVEDEYISESGLDGDDASSQSGNDEMGGGAEGRQKATGLPSANRLRNRGRSVGSRPGVPLADGGGAGAGVRGGVQELPVRASPVVGGGSHGRSGGVDGEGTSEDSGLHRDGNEGQNVRGDGGESVRRAGNPLQLQPGHALTQNVGDNFIATQKVVDAWEETDLVKRAERNIEALDVLDSLGWPSAESQESDDVVQTVRIGTPEREVSLEEKEILASYTGWAGFQEVLYNGDIEAAFRRYEQLNKEYDEAGIPRDDELTIPAAVQKMMAARHIEGADIEERLIEGLKTYLKLIEIIPENIRQTFRYWHPDEESVNRRNGSGDQNAPAMPLNIAEAILDAAADSGLAGGYFLQPTGGWGREVMLTGGRFASDTNWTIFEPNTIKAKILKALFPKANLFSEHQRKADIAQGFFDFGVMVAPNDQSNTDSWTYSHGKHIQGLTRAENDIVRLVERIRPGGLAIFVHSEPTKSQAQRLAREIGIVKGRVLGVIKAPANMLGYKEPSGNSADIWIVQRETTKVVNADVFSGPSENAGIPLETTIGFDVDTDEDGRITMTPQYPDLTIRDKRKFGDELYDAIMNSAMSNADRSSLADPTSARFKNRLAQAAEIVKRERPNGETFIDDKGVLRIIESGKSKRIRIGSKNKNSKISDFEYSTSQLSGAKEEEVLAIQKSYEKLREALKAVIEADRTRSEDANDKRAALNSAYSEFVDEHGQLGLQAEEEEIGLAAKVIFLDRYNSSQLAGHIGFDKEKGVDVLGDIFRKNPFTEMPEDTIPSNAQEALLRSMRNKGYIDAVYVGDALGITPRAAVEKMLEERIAFIDPATQKLVDRSEYLSGLVRHKYEQAKKASAFDGRFIANMEELQRVMNPVTTFDVSDERDKPQVSVGCGFIPDDIMHKFFDSINISGLNKIHYSRTVGKWILNVNWKKVTLANPMILGLGSNAGSQKHIRIKAWLNQNPVIVKNENGMPDIEATQEVERLFNDLNDQLANFIESNPSRKAAVERAYWEHLGDDAVERDYQGYELRVPGMSSKWIANISGADRWYQRRAINGVFYGDIQMLDHNVGAGKTAEMIIATMMLKHYGRIRKPMLVVKLATIDQIRQSIVDIFPGARVLTLDSEDFQPGNRLTTLDLIREFDGDMIIIPHSAFGRIGFSEGLIDEIMAQESLDYDNDIATVRELYPELNEKGKIRSKEGRDLLAEIEKAKERALRQYKKLYSDAQANRSVAYDQLGIDYLIVDEAHNFKSVEHYTSKTPKGAKFRGINIKSESSNVSKSMIAACHYSNKLHGGKNGVLFATGTPLSNSFVEAYTMMNYLIPSRMREMGMPRLDSFLNTYCGWKLDFTPREGGFDMEIGLTIRNAFPLSKLLRQAWDVALAGHEFQLKGMPGLKPAIVQVPQSTTQSYAIEAFGELANRIAEGEKIPGINKGYLQQYGRWIAINPYLVGIADANNARARVQAKIIKSLNNKDPKMAHLVFCDIGAPKEFRFKSLTDIGGDTFEVVTANGRVATIGPRNLNSGQRKITIRQEFKKDASLTEYREVSWSYLDKIPGEATGGAPFNPTALYKALIRLERGALAMFGKSSEISARKTGSAYSKGTLKEKGKVREGKALDFSALIEKQIAELGYDPRLDVIQSKEDMMIPPISKREIQEFLITGDFNGLMDYISSKPMYHLYQGHVFDEYSRMKLELLREGFKEDEIVVVNNKEDFTSEIEKDLNDKNGKIKVILASKTIQEGVNIQRRLMSVHHHDIPWMPGDKTQRDGRGWRFGNENKDVYVFNYVTPDSADGKSYSIVAGKARIFSQVQTVPEHNRLDSAVDESGSLQEMISFAVKDKRVYWRDRLTKQLESNTRIVDGETRRIGELETSIASLKRGRDNQVRIVEEAKEEILPIFKAREEAKREFAIDTPDGRKLTGLAEVIEYIQDEAVKIPLPPVPKSMAEVQAEGSANEREIGKVFGAPVIVSLEWGIASPGMEDTDPLGLYTPRYFLAIPGGIKGMIPLEKVKNPETGKFTPRITDFQVTNGIKGGLTRLLNPVSENRLVPKSLAKMEDDLLDYNERIHNSENMLKNAHASLEKAQEPIYSIRSRLKMIEDSIKADIDHDPQPIAGFIENINDYMSEPGEDEESSLWKIDGGAILDEGAFDMKKHVTPPKVKSSETDPDNPDGPDTPPPTGTDGGGGSMEFADTSYAVSPVRTSATDAAFLAQSQGENGLGRLKNGIISRRSDEDAKEYIRRITAAYPTATRLAGKSRLQAILEYSVDGRLGERLTREIQSIPGLSRQGGSRRGGSPTPRAGLDRFVRLPRGVIRLDYAAAEFFYPIAEEDIVDDILIHRLLLNLEVFGEALGVRRISGFARGDDNVVYAIVETGGVRFANDVSPRKYFLENNYRYGNMGGGYDEMGTDYYTHNKTGYEVGDTDLVFVTSSRTNRTAPVFADIVDNRGERLYRDQMRGKALQGAFFADTAYAVNPVTPAEDAAYMDAVERGDMETAQRMVREAFLRAFPNTKVLDKDGLPLMVYHGTASDEQIYAFDFSQNNPNRMEHTPVGTVWFTSNREIAGGYNGGGEPNIYPVFLNIENPASADAKGYAFKDEEFGFGDVKSGKGFSTGNFVRRAQNSSKDGVIIRNIIDAADSADIVADDYIVFNPSQIKSADHVTYDDAGNVIPLSQRFNPENSDIRFADTAFEVDPLTGITNAEQDESLTSRGMNAPKKRVRGDERVLRGAEEIGSNPEFLETLANVVRKNPRPIKAEENIALAIEWQEVKDEYDDVVHSLSEAVNAGDGVGVRELKARKKELEKRMVAIVDAREAGVGEAARTLRTNRFLFRKDYSFAGLVAQRTADLGRQLTDIEYKELTDIAKALEKIDEEERDLITKRIKAHADKIIKDYLESLKSGKKDTHTVDEMRLMLRKRNEALAQIEVLAYELGGEINALAPTGDAEDFESAKFLNMRKYLRNLAEYHVYHNPNLTEHELIEMLIEDISPWFTADMHIIRQIFSGYGHSWQIDRNERQRKVSDLTTQSRILEQILSLENGEMVRLTGPQRSEPSDTARELARIRDQLRRQLERAGMVGSDKHLKTMLATAKTRYEHMISDIKAALAAGAQLQKREPLNITDPELDALKAEYQRLREEYDAIWGKGSKMTDEQKREMVVKTLERTLERWTEKLARAKSGDFSTDPKAPKVTSEAIETLREKIKMMAEEYRQLKAARRIEEWTEEEIRAYAKRRLDAVNKALRHWQTASITGDIAPKKKPDIPFPNERMRRDYERLVEERNRAYRKILDMREHDKHKNAPLGIGYAMEYASFVNNMMRSLLATADFSAMMRQTAAITTAHPVTALKTLFKSIGPLLRSSKAFAIDEELRNNPLVREALNNKWLEWRAIEGSGGSDEVEMFHGVDAQAITLGKRKDGTERRYALGDIPFLKSILHASERQYATFINMISAELYTKMVNSPVWGKSGPTDFQKKEIASYINMANGSAQLGAKGKQAMAMLTKVFWAPKLAVSRAQLAIGAGIVHPFVSGQKGDANMKERGAVAGYLALEQARALLGAVAAGWLMLALFGDDDDKYAQEQAEGMSALLKTIRPRIGSSSLDFSGGVAQWWNLMRMAYTGVKETASGKQINLSETYGRSKTQELWRFFQGKLNPLWSNALAMWEGKDYVGNEFGIWNLAQNTFIPLAGRDIWEAASNENNGLGRGLLMAPFILSGAGGSTYDIDRYKAAKDLVNARVDALDEAAENKDRAGADELKAKYPELAHRKQLKKLFDKAKKTEALIKRREKKGLAVPQSLRDQLEKQKSNALEAFRRWR